MIRVCCEKNNIELEEGKVYACIEDTLYRFPVPIKMNDEITLERKGGLVGKQAVGFFRGGWDPEEWKSGNRGPGPISRTQPQTNPTPQKTAASSAAAIAAALDAREQTPPLSSTSQSGNPTSDSGEKLPKKKGSSSKRQPKSEQQDNVTNIDTAKRYKGYGGLLYTKKQIEDALAGGCAFCEKTFIALTDKHGWLAKNKPVCEKCLEGEHDNHVKTEVSEVTVH